jgi:hypothetical protein
MPEETPTLALALFDLVPVFLAGTAFVLLADVVGRRRPDLRPIVFAGGVMATAGGGLQAIWKVVVAAGGPDITVMGEALFPLLSAGFALMALALFSLGDRGAFNKSALGLVAIIWGTGFGLSLISDGASSGYFISVVTLAEVVMVVLLWRWARREGTHIGWYVGIHLFLVIALSGMARAVEQTNALQWVEESVNVVTQGLLLIAVLRLRSVLVVEPEAETIAG